MGPENGRFRDRQNLYKSLRRKGYRGQSVLTARHPSKVEARLQWSVAAPGFHDVPLPTPHYNTRG